MNSVPESSLKNFKSSSELEGLLYLSAKRNSTVAAITCFAASMLGLFFGYGYALTLVPFLLSGVLGYVSLNITNDNFRISERITFLLSILLVIFTLFVSNTITTVVIFLPALAYLFFVEANKKVRWATVAAILCTILASAQWFFPNLTIGLSGYDVRYEALFDVIVAAVFTGLFVRFHLNFMRFTLSSDRQQATNHSKYVDASRIAYDSLAAQKIDLDKIYDAARVALRNDRLAYAQIAASQDQLEQFAYAASHDLKEPIRTIRSFLQVVRRRLPDEVIDEEGLAEHFEFVEQSSETMHRLLERLLIYSRIERQSSTKKSFGIVSILQRVASNPDLGLNEIGAQVSVKLPDELFEIDAFMNPEHAASIFQELFNNSILFKSDVRTLEIAIEVDIVNEETIMISFVDNGIGIEDQYHEQVFGLFKRLNTREDYPGSGLGLSLVRSIVDSAGGEVSLTSVMGRGTEVYLLLPRIEKAATDPMLGG
jgi:signal transduction histidine kinase